jgi:hypothetical protein
LKERPGFGRAMEIVEEGAPEAAGVTEMPGTSRVT